MNAYNYSNPIVRRLNGRARWRAFIRNVTPYVGAVALVVFYVVAKSIGG